MQPVELRGTGKIPTISLEQILEVCRKVPEAEIESWNDINRIDMRPSRGILKIWAKLLGNKVSPHLLARTIVVKYKTQLRLLMKQKKSRKF